MQFEPDILPKIFKEIHPFVGNGQLLAELILNTLFKVHKEDFLSGFFEVVGAGEGRESFTHSTFASEYVEPVGGFLRRYGLQ